MVADPLALLADRLDPPTVDVFRILGYTPTPRQAEFHAATEYDVLYGGAAGGGKSRALVMEAIRACIRYPGIRVGAYRRTYGELEESLLAELAKVGYAVALGARWKSNPPELSFPNGSKILFRHAETLVHASRRQGGERQLLLVDESTLVNPAVIDHLAERMRSSDPAIPVLGIRRGSNPGGPGHSRHRIRFVKATEHGKKSYVDDDGLSVRFVEAKYTDNPHLNAGYEAVLNAIADPARRAAMRDGSWDAFAGQMFPQWRHGRHVVAPFALPSSWRRHAGIDWGYAAPWAVVWVAVDEDRRVWLYREIAETEVGEAEQARRILAAEWNDPRPARVADPAMWARRGDAASIAAAYIANNCGIRPANNDRVAGWQRIHSYLAEAPACRLHRDQGWATCPNLHVFDSCTETIRTIADLPRDPRKPEDADTKADDHLPDALRYVLLDVGGSSAIERSVQPAPEPAFTDDLMTAGF